MEKTYGKSLCRCAAGEHSDCGELRANLGTKTVLMGFGLDSDAIHSPNEHYGLFNYFKGIETIPHFHAEFAARHA